MRITPKNNRTGIATRQENPIKFTQKTIDSIISLFIVTPHQRSKKYPLKVNMFCKGTFFVPGARLELARIIHPRDFKSLVSTNSTTRANYKIKMRSRPELNRRTGFCRPLPNHSATRPLYNLYKTQNIKNMS